MERTPRMILATFATAAALVGCTPDKAIKSGDIVNVTKGSLWSEAGGLGVRGNTVTCVPNEDQDFKLVQSEDLGDGGKWYEIEPVSDPNAICFSGWVSEQRIEKDSNK
jgi:hypothetical protein